MDCKHKDMCELSVKRGTKPYVNNCCDSCPAKNVNYTPNNKPNSEPAFVNKIINKLGHSEDKGLTSYKQPNFMGKVVKK